MDGRARQRSIWKRVYARNVVLYGLMFFETVGGPGQPTFD